MQQRDLAALWDMLDQIRVIQEQMRGVTREEFLSDVRLQAAVTYWVAIIGEAATRLSGTFRDAHPGVEWRDIRDMRNFLIHVYDKVDYSQVWDTVQNDLEPLRIAGEQILADESPTP